MKSKVTIGSGFTKQDIFKIETHLHRLLQYIDTNHVVFVGGLAIRYFVSKAGISYPRRPFNDLDLIAENLNYISPTITNTFLVYHHHPEVNGTFYLVLVDPISKTKIDIFDYSFAPEEIIKVPYETYSLQLQSPEDQLVKTVFDTQRISESAHVDPKQFRDAQVLLSIVNRRKAERFWEKKHLSPPSLITSFHRAETIAKSHPDWLQEKPTRKPMPYICPGCVSTTRFPVTPMEKIYKVLGYVE